MNEDARGRGEDEKDGWKHMKMLEDGIEYRTRLTEVNVHAGGGG